MVHSSAHGNDILVLPERTPTLSSPGRSYTISDATTGRQFLQGGLDPNSTFFGGISNGKISLILKHSILESVPRLKFQFQFCNYYCLEIQLVPRALNQSPNSISVSERIPYQGLGRSGNFQPVIKDANYNGTGIYGGTNESTNAADVTYHSPISNPNAFVNAGTTAGGVNSSVLNSSGLSNNPSQQVQQHLNTSAIGGGPMPSQNSIVSQSVPVASSTPTNSSSCFRALPKPQSSQTYSAFLQELQKNGQFSSSSLPTSGTLNNAASRLATQNVNVTQSNAVPHVPNSWSGNSSQQLGQISEQQLAEENEDIYREKYEQEKQRLEVGTKKLTLLQSQMDKLKSSAVYEEDPRVLQESQGKLQDDNVLALNVNPILGSVGFARVSNVYQN